MLQAPRHILCVDDEPNILDVAKMALETVGGFKVSVCGSGTEALAKAEAIRPDMILLDVMMPGMDGPTTFHGIKAIENLEHIPIAFMTAKVQPKEVASYLALGATGVIFKPFDPMTVSEEVVALWKAHHRI